MERKSEEAVYFLYKINGLKMERVKTIGKGCYSLDNMNRLKVKRKSERLLRPR